ncbi:hypothetical protein I6A60_23105 [Frankia sp. AgB1.9]|uniref:hypothetical protein n=1 Tax=unclassified Frankia TaxID=2632575 RepID=UPI0019334723|nr:MULTISPECIES: hypothetical protein [unclassified Frankia]MBL7489669.1 hypothetical protein [Frankia sp. AgW1.1]MBL7550736.1 hypothetical protein [Frankia sp. AgB1.9]MBL7624353.1 hypothetical protein [Frankia sp. AgB1.8]
MAGELTASRVAGTGPIASQLDPDALVGHKATHTAAGLDSVGRLLGSTRFPATEAGYAGLLGWMRGFGVVVKVGVEGTGRYGNGLALISRWRAS